MKIYTRTGDGGNTGLFGGPRVPKDDQRIEAYGTVDELNAALGLARAADVSAEISVQLEQIQRELFSVGAELATPDPNKHDLRIIDGSHVARLEQWIDAHEDQLAPLNNFILPGGSEAACRLHLARSICRRAERRVVTFARDVDVSDDLLIYLNRLSDLLFVLARAANHHMGTSETEWQRPK